MYNPLCDQSHATLITQSSPSAREHSLLIDTPIQHQTMPVRIWHPRIRKGSRNHHASSLVTHAGTFEEGGQNVALVLTPKSNGDNVPTLLKDKKAGVFFGDGDNKQDPSDGAEEGENDPKKDRSLDTMTTLKTNSPIIQPTDQDSTAIGREAIQSGNELSIATKTNTEEKREVRSLFGNSKTDKAIDHILVSTQSKTEVDYVYCAPEDTLAETKTQRGKRCDDRFSEHSITSTEFEIEVEWKPKGAKQRKTKIFKFRGSKKADKGHTNNIPSATTETTSSQLKDSVISPEETSKPTQTESAVAVLTKGNGDWIKNLVPFLGLLANTGSISEVRDATKIVPTESKIEIAWKKDEKAHHTMTNNVTTQPKKSSYPTTRKEEITSTQSRVEVSREEEAVTNPSTHGLTFLVRLLESAKGTPEIDQLTEIITNHSKIETPLKTESPMESIVEEEETVKSKPELRANTKASNLDPRVEVIPQTQFKAKEDCDEGISIPKQTNTGIDWRKGLHQLTTTVQSGTESSQIKDLSHIISTNSKIEVDWKDSPKENETIGLKPRTTWRAGKKKARMEPQEEVILPTESKIEVNLNKKPSTTYQSKGSNAGSEWRKGLLQLIRMVESGLKSSEIERFSQIIATQSKVEIDWNINSVCSGDLNDNSLKDQKTSPLIEAAASSKIVSNTSELEVGCGDASTNDNDSNTRCLDKKSEANVRISIVHPEKEVKTKSEQSNQEPLMSIELREGACQQKEPVHSLNESCSGPDISAIESHSVVTRQFSEHHGQTDTNKEKSCGEACELDPYITVEHQVTLQENMSSTNNTCKQEHCTPKESMGWKEEILSTLACIASPKTTRNIKSTTQEPDILFGNNESLIILGLDDSKFVEKSPQAHQPMPEQKVDIVPPVEEAKAHLVSDFKSSKLSFGVTGHCNGHMHISGDTNNLKEFKQQKPEQKLDIVSPVEKNQTHLVLSPAPDFKYSVRSSGVAGHTNGNMDISGETVNLKESMQQKSISVPSRFQKLWNNTPPERQAKWLTALNSAIESARQQQATWDESTLEILSEIIEESTVKVEGAVAEINEQHVDDDDDDDASTASLDLLWQLLTCRQHEAHQKQGADPHGKVFNTETEDLDMLIDILSADKMSASASTEDANEFPVPPGDGNPMLSKKTRNNANLRIINSI